MSEVPLQAPAYALYGWRVLATGHARDSCGPLTDMKWPAANKLLP